MASPDYKVILDFIRSLYVSEHPVSLHAPKFFGNEKKYLAECIDSTFVSYVGKFVTDFEQHVKHLTGAHNAVAIVNGTSALQMALMSAGVASGDEVITQVLTFAATAAAIRHSGAEPAFIDVDRETLGMSPESLQKHLDRYAECHNGETYNKYNGRRIAAIVPMHTFGHPVRMDEILLISKKYGIQVIEDAAESVGSYYKGKHTGIFGRASILSFNGNKPVTTGGGGMIITNDNMLAERVRHITTTAKQKHRWEFIHDEAGYNLRMSNVNAALGCAQMENIDFIINNKRETAEKYMTFFSSVGIHFISEPENCRSNYWLNAIVLKDRNERDSFLEYSNDNGIQTRPIWMLLTKLSPYEKCMRGDTPNAEWFEDRVVNIPSGVR